MLRKIKANVANFFIPSILPFILLAVLIKLALAGLPSFEVDMGTWLSWAGRMYELGPAKFYSDTVWTQYTPLTLYYLWSLAKLGLASEFAIKFTVILADFIGGYLIWKQIADRRMAYFAFFAYVLNPVVIFNGAVWGQIDSVLALLLLLSSYFLVNKKVYLSGIFWALAFLLKPQAFVFLIPAIFIIWKIRFGFGGLARFVLAALAVLMLLSIPFFPKNNIFGLMDLVIKMTEHYSYTSVFAFNFWSVVGMWLPDSLKFLGLTYQKWGFAMFFLASAFVLYLLYKSKGQVKTLYLGMSLILFASFLFPTRVHERYLFPFFPFFLIAAANFKSRFMLYVYAFLTILCLINLYHPYAFYSENYLKSEALLNFTGLSAKPVGVLFILSFFAVLYFLAKNVKLSVPSTSILSFRKLLRISKESKLTNRIPEMSSSKLTKQILLFILFFAFICRIFSLATPQKEYFDEVYHAFTARRMLHSDPKAWEWWNTPPEGYAYEWTHPPVAKYGMVLGMLVFGENSFGWRFPGAILGVVSVYLVYLIAKYIFKDELTALISAFLFSLDGISLVLSRIGMNDIYFLTFALLAIYLFLKNKYFYSSIFLGISLASKWSGVWTLPVMLGAHFVLKKKISYKYIYFIIIPPIVYVLSYIPFFTTGHTWVQFFNWEAVVKCINVSACQYPYGLQQQMLWYHTNLHATHAYTSLWWSWPLNFRPVYLYTSDVVANMVGRIYLIGNPFLSWLGLLVVIFAILRAPWTRERKTILFIVFSYLVYFIPWALSPRIMFLYHYLPSIPFMAIILGYHLRKYPKLGAVVIPIVLISFIYFYPHWTGLQIPEWWDKSYYWFSSWR